MYIYRGTFVEVISFGLYKFPYDIVWVDPGAVVFR
jgi:hypothetical protein